MVSNPDRTLIPIDGDDHALDDFPSEVSPEQVLVQWDDTPLAAPPPERLALADPIPKRTTSAISFLAVAVVAAALIGGVRAWRLPAAERPLTGPNAPVAEMAATSLPPAVSSEGAAPLAQLAKPANPETSASPANKEDKLQLRPEGLVFTSKVTAKAARGPVVAAVAPTNTRRSRDAVRFSPMLAPAPPPSRVAQPVQRTVLQSSPASMPVTERPATIATFGSTPPATIATFGSTPPSASVRPEPAVASPDSASSRPEPAQARPETAAPAAPASAAARAPVPAPLPRVDEDAAVRVVLGRYRDAYDRLDADAAKRVWPGVDERALSRAFASLESQSIRFDDCRTTVTGANATAACRGTATYVGRLGNRNSQTQNREWTFTLQKDGSAWTVRRVQVR